MEYKENRGLLRYIDISHIDKMEYNEIIYDFTKLQNELRLLTFSSIHLVPIVKGFNLYFTSLQRRNYVITINKNEFYDKDFFKRNFTLFYISSGKTLRDSSLGITNQIKFKVYQDKKHIDVIIKGTFFDQLIKLDLENNHIILNSEVDKNLNL